MFYVSVCPLGVTLVFASDGDFWSKQFLEEEEKYQSVLGFSHMNVLIMRSLVSWPLMFPKLLNIIIKHWKIAKRSPEYISLVVEVSSCSLKKVMFWKFCQKFVSCDKLIFFSFVTIQVLKFFTIQVFEVCHKLSLWVLHHLSLRVLLRLGFLSFVKVWLFEFCHNLSWWLLSQF